MLIVLHGAKLYSAQIVSETDIKHRHNNNNCIELRFDNENKQRGEIVRKWKARASAENGGVEKRKVK